MFRQQKLGYLVFETRQQRLSAAPGSSDDLAAIGLEPPDNAALVGGG